MRRPEERGPSSNCPQEASVEEKSVSLAKYVSEYEDLESDSQ